ncbi:hypothetical protein POTOM_006398 [Populus tomentosa]|uniref:DEK-C domain-containing protein n=1 Tax=Populus tomentosa TaxID=118781 RepID=A0A8X8DEU1_POPTO|nr:hypothetical protein POTOM_006398 [Populus tomentosa]
MGKEENETKVPEVAANGTSAPEKEKSNEVMTEKREEINGVKEMEEDKNDSENSETDKMDEGPRVTEEKESKEKEDKEEGRTEAMEEETEPILDEEMEEKEKEAKEEVEEKVDGSKEEEEVEEEKTEEEVEETVERSKEEEKKLEEGKRSKQRGKGKSDGRKAEKKKKVVEEKKEPEPRTPAFDRPQRERKSVERLVATIDKDAVKEFQIEKGQGTPLKDIPNVAFKLSRRKIDDTFKLLHTILFGRRGKALQIKSNISRFSGFVWHQNEEKQKSKVKEKFDKCNKEKLLEFCDFLDIPLTKATTKKEDIVMKLIDFLVAPHATTTELFAEKEKEKASKKRKRVAKSSSYGSTPSKRSAKPSAEKLLKARLITVHVCCLCNSTALEECSLQNFTTVSPFVHLECLQYSPFKRIWVVLQSRGKVDDDSKRRDKKSTADTEDESDEEKEESDEEKEEEEQEQENVEEENENGALDKSDAEISEHSESEEKKESEEESEEDTGKRKKRSATSSRKKASKTRISVSGKSSPPVKRTPKKSSSKRPHSDEDSDASPKVSSSKKKTEKVSKEKPLPPKKSASKEKMVKKGGKEKEKAGVKEDKLTPSDDELRDAICKILKEVDFNTATFTDILKLLARRFATDLTPRKSSIKLVIQEELTKLADDADEEDGEGDAEKDETQSTGQEVEA